MGLCHSLVGPPLTLCTWLKWSLWLEMIFVFCKIANLPVINVFLMVEKKYQRVVILWALIHLYVIPEKQQMSAQLLVVVLTKLNIWKSDEYQYLKKFGLLTFKSFLLTWHNYVSVDRYPVLRYEIKIAWM